MKRSLLSIIFLSLFTLFALSLTAQKVDVNVEPVSVNTNDNSEIAPFLFNDDFYFLSNRKNSFLMSAFDKSNMPMYRLYKGRLIDDSEVMDVEEVAFNGAFYDMYGPAVVSGCGTKLIFTRSRSETFKESSRTSPVRLDLYEADYPLNNSERTVRQLPFGSDEWSVLHPSLSCDGQRLFFVMDKPGGYGESDIYMSPLTSEGWGEPENLGDVINSSGSEFFPFYHSSGKLYFTSNGHGSNGNANIFYSEYVDGWQPPVKLDYPINSEYDDFGSFIFDDETKGYFASSRSGSDDIYYFEFDLRFCEEGDQVVEDSYCFTFYEESAIETDTLPNKYLWDFGDGDTLAGKEVNFCFDGPGNYDIILNVVDSITGQVQYQAASYSLNLEETKQVYINDPGVIDVDSEVTFSAELKGFGKVDAPNYFWDLGDGVIKRGRTVKAEFVEPGEYKIWCEVYWEGNSVCSYRIVEVK
ncbi:PKD domain-containing protein [Marinilabiliaceae bacterium ANBcel2]|nr:PKD domain-containing protein [Marinilabiliaceae bacterium ANBcel2]